MSADRDVTRIVRSWLEEGATRLPDRVLDTVLDQLPATPQRRAPWPVRRLRLMNIPARIAAAAAAVAAIVLIGVIALPKGSGVGQRSTPTPTATPVPSPSPIALHPGALAAGTYTLAPFTGPDAMGVCAGQSGCAESAADDSIRFTFAVPAGWESIGPQTVWLAGKAAPPDGAGLVFERGGSLYRNPCNPSPPPNIPVGPTVDDFTSALESHGGLAVTPASAVTLGGYSGKYLDLVAPADITGCPSSWFPWEPGLYAQGPSHRWHLWILDVDGVRVVVQSMDYAGTSPANQAALQGIVDSIKIQP